MKPPVVSSPSFNELPRTRRLRLLELFRERDRIVTLVRAELISSSSQSPIGPLWWFLDPFILMLIFWVFKVILLGRGTYAPYPVFIGCALIPWKFWRTILGRSAGLLRSRKALIRSFSFPIVTLPGALVLSQVVYLVVGYLAVIGIALIMGSGLQLAAIQSIPLFFFVTTIALGGAAALTGVGSLHEDVGKILDHLLTAIWYLSPGLYGIDLIARAAGEDSTLFAVYKLLPTSLVFESFRATLFAPRWIDWTTWLALVGWSLFALVSGELFFRLADRRLLKRL